MGQPLGKLVRKEAWCEINRTPPPPSFPFLFQHDIENPRGDEIESTSVAPELPNMERVMQRKGISHPPPSGVNQGPTPQLRLFSQEKSTPGTPTTSLLPARKAPGPAEKSDRREKGFLLLLFFWQEQLPREPPAAARAHSRGTF